MVEACINLLFDTGHFPDSNYRLHYIDLGFLPSTHEPSQVRKSSYPVLGSKLPFFMPISKDIRPSHVSILDTP